MCLVCLLLCKVAGSSPVSAITERGGYEHVRGALVYVFVGFWDRDYVSQLPCVRYYVVIKRSFKHT